MTILPPIRIIIAACQGKIIDKDIFRCYNFTKTDRSVEILEDNLKKILTVLLIAALVLSGCTQNQAIDADQEEAYTPVEVETLKPADLYIENIMTAKVFADKDVFVIPVMAGKVERINVNVGDRVLIQGPTTGSQEMVLEAMLVDQKPGDLKASKSDIITFKTDFRIRPSDKLYKIVENN